MSGYVLDDLFLRELGRGDDTLTNLVAALDAAAERMSVPSITLTAAHRGLSDPQRDMLHGVIEYLPRVRLEPLTDLDHTRHVSLVAEHLGDAPDLAAAHAIAISRYLDFPILTTSERRWGPVLDRLPWQVAVVEASDPD
ncbi:hypothetical protein ACWEJ6_48790 [Nonomuraea sp. NPDC004702]